MWRLTWQSRPWNLNMREYWLERDNLSWGMLHNVDKAFQLLHKEFEVCLESGSDQLPANAFHLSQRWRYLRCLEMYRVLCQSWCCAVIQNVKTYWKQYFQSSEVCSSARVSTILIKDQGALREWRYFSRYKFYQDNLWIAFVNVTLTCELAINSV